MNQGIYRVLRNFFSLNKFDLQRKRNTFYPLVLFKSIDAAIIAHLYASEPSITRIKTLLDLRTPHYKRVAALINLINGVLPGASWRIAQSLCCFDYLPLISSHKRLIAHGSGSNVFLMDSQDERKVLKVFRRSLGKSGESLLEVATEYKGKYETLSSWYNEVYQIVLPAAFLILHGPILNAPVAAVLQTYITGEVKDPFHDFATEDLANLLRQEPYLKDQFCFFARKTLQVYSQQGLCFDFIGKNNLMLVKKEKDYRLFIIDYGIFDISKIRTRWPDLLSKIEGHIDRLETLLNSI